MGNSIKSTSVVLNEDIDTVLENIEADIIMKGLKNNQGNVAKTAKDLGLNRQTLDYRIKKYNISENL